MGIVARHALSGHPLRCPQLRLKASPVLFDRTPEGHILIPSWEWASMFEALSHNPTYPQAWRDNALRSSREDDFHDAVLPLDTQTIEVMMSDHQGGFLVVEALPPGTRVTFVRGTSTDRSTPMF